MNQRKFGVQCLSNLRGNLTVKCENFVKYDFFGRKNFCIVVLGIHRMPQGEKLGLLRYTTVVSGFGLSFVGRT